MIILLIQIEITLYVNTILYGCATQHIKNPNIISAIIKKANENGNNIETLDKIIDKALALKNHSK